MGISVGVLRTQQQTIQGILRVYSGISVLYYYLDEVHGMVAQQPRFAGIAATPSSVVEEEINLGQAIIDSFTNHLLSLRTLEPVYLRL